MTSAPSSRGGRPRRKTEEELRAETVADFEAHGPLLLIREDLAALTADGFTPVAPQRHVVQTVQQARRAGRLLEQGEWEALMLFAEHMVRTPTPTGDQFVVEGFNEDWLKAHGMATGDARRANSNLKARGLLLVTNPDGEGLMSADRRSHVVLGDRFCGISSAAPSNLLPRRKARRERPTGIETRATAAAPKTETKATPVVDNFSGPDFKETEIRETAPVDNFSFPGFKETEIKIAPEAKPQVSPGFSFPLAGATSSSRREGSNYPCTTPNGEIEFASLLAFARDGRLRSALGRHQQRLVGDLTGAIKRLPQGDRRVARASGILGVLGHPDGGDPIAAVAQMALGLLLVEDEAMDQHGAGLIARLRNRGVMVPADTPVAPLNVALATALMAATDFDQKRPGGWLYSVLTGSAKFRHDGAVAEFLAVLRNSGALPVDEPGGYGAADLNNEAYRARLAEARQVIWSVYADARDDETWEKYVVPNYNRHARVFALADEVLSRQASGGGAVRAQAAAF